METQFCFGFRTLQLEKEGIREGRRANEQTESVVSLEMHTALNPAFGFNKSHSVAF